MDDVLKTVDGGDLAFAALIGASYDSDFVVLSDWDRADLKSVRLRGDAAVSYTNIVFFSELLAQRRAHDCTSDTGWCIVMSLARFSP